jgi:hypothetical protein
MSASRTSAAARTKSSTRRADVGCRAGVDLRCHGARRLGLKPTAPERPRWPAPGAQGAR